MLKTQIDTRDMLLSIENKFDDNPDLWKDNIPVKEVLEDFREQLTELTNEIILQQTDPSGITEDKKRIRKELEELLFRLSSGVYAYSVKVKNSKLTRHLHLPITTIEHFRDSELQTTALAVQRELRELGVVVAPYGATETTLTALFTKTEEFSTIMKNPRDGIAIVKEATKNIARSLTSLSDLLKTRLDPLMHAFKLDHPEFVEVYFDLRVVKPTGSRALSLTVITLDQATNLPIDKAKLEILGEDIKRVSSKRGYNKVAHLNEGTHRLKVTRTKYKEKTVEFTVVSGETAELVVLLEAL